MVEGASTGVASKRRRLRYPAGILAVCLLLASSRWGSYIGVAPAFLADALFAVAVLHALASRALAKAHTTRSRPTIGLNVLAAGALVWVLARAVTSVPYSVLWARDLEPYLLISAFFLAAWRVTEADDRVAVLLRRCLMFRAGWIAVSFFFPDVTSALPTLPNSSVRVLEIRADVDSASLGVLAALLLRRGLGVDRRRWDLALSAAALSLSVALQSRAGVVAAVLVVALAGVSGVRSLERGSYRKASAVALVVAGVLALTVTMPNTTTGQRFLGVPAAIGVGEDPERGGGTATARQRGWSLVTDFMLRDRASTLVGVGFGPDFLAASGAAPLFEGTTFTNVRSPHNYLVGSFARLGFPGVFLLGMLLLMGVVRAARVLLSEGAREIETLASFVVLAYVVVGLLGVVLESPFGAGPFFWCLGVVASARVRR